MSILRVKMVSTSFVLYHTELAIYLLQSMICSPFGYVLILINKMANRRMGLESKQSLYSVVHVSGRHIDKHSFGTVPSGWLGGTVTSTAAVVLKY